MSSRKKTSEADLAAVGVLIAIALVIVSAGVLAVYFLLRLPLRRCTKGNSAVPLAYIGIVTIMAGLLIGSYQAIAGDPALQSIDRLTPLPWLIFGIGMAIYLFSLLLITAYKGRLRSLYEAAIVFGQSGTLSTQLLGEMRLEGKRVGISSSDIDLTLRDVDSLNSLALINRGVLPRCEPPQNIFLKADEEPFFFRFCVFYEDTNYQMRYTEGNTMYWRVSQNLTMAPTQRVSKTMTVTELTQKDHGVLLFTSKRVRFQGETNDFDYWLSGIIGIDEYSNGIQLHYEGKRKRQIFSMDPLSSQLFAEMVRKSAQVRKISAKL